MILPPAFQDWFARQGWQPHPHQLALLAAEGDSLLIAPTGGGKTLAGFLPSLVRLARECRPLRRLDTLYISPLKALSTDVARNLERPIRELDLPVTTFVRTGDTPANRRDMPDADFINIVLGSLDDPDDVRPVRQSGVEARVPWFLHLPDLPGSETDEPGPEAAERHLALLASNHQHPDYDTEHWPLEE